MKNRFDHQLEKLNIELVTMGALCEEAIGCAGKALFERDMHFAELAEEAESNIDRMEREIEDRCMRLLLQFQPVASDLRVISSAMKMIGDMERIGDQAADVAEIVRYMEDKALVSEENLKPMAEFAASMVTSSIDSFVNRDLELAQKIIADDDVVDEYFDKIKKDLIDSISGGAQNGEFLLDILMIAKYIERVADHATNIAEWVVYSITGTHKEIADQDNMPDNSRYITRGGV